MDRLHIFGEKPLGLLDRNKPGDQRFQFVCIPSCLSPDSTSEQVSALARPRRNGVKHLASSSGLRSSFPTSSRNSRLAHLIGDSPRSSKPAGTPQNSRLAPCLYWRTRGISPSLCHATTKTESGERYQVYFAGGESSVELCLRSTRSATTLQGA